MSGIWYAGLWVAGAAALAVDQVNADKTLLRGRVLEYTWANSGCSAKQGLAAMGELLAGESRIDGVIGPGCSSACEVTSYLSGGQGIAQVSWGWYVRTFFEENGLRGLVCIAAHRRRYQTKVSLCWYGLAPLDVVALTSQFVPREKNATGLNI